MNGPLPKTLRAMTPPGMSPSRAVIGLTGNPGSGKSTVARLMESMGAVIVDADAAGHQLLEPDSPVYEELIREFGTGILAGKEISRKVLGTIVFGSPERLEALNRIVHPHLIRRIQERIDAFRTSGDSGPLVVDAALLFEWGIERIFDTVTVVTAPKEERQKRLLESRNIPADEFCRRDASQIPESDKERQADAVIRNEGDLDALRYQVERFMTQ